MDPLTLSSVTICLLVWAVLGGAAFLTLRADCPKDALQQVWFHAVSGPVAWALGALGLWRTLRHRALRAFGVAGYSCCGGHGYPERQRHSHGERHPDWEPSARGRSNSGWRCARGGYEADKVLNHPAVP